MIKNRIKKIYSAKSSLRVKIFAGFIGLSLILSVSLGYTLYKVSNSIYYKSFLQHNKSLGISIANGIDGDIFQMFINERSIEMPEFKRYLNYLRSVAANEEYITWIYSVVIDKKSNKLIYAIDATPIPEDTIWVENHYIGLKVYINRKGQLSVFWDSVERTSDFTVKYKNRVFEVEIDSSADELKINNRPILKVIKL